MEFNFDEFLKEKYVPREKVLTLGNFGDSSESVSWTVRGLTAIELAKVDAAIDANQQLAKLMATVTQAVSADSDTKTKVDAQTEILEKTLGVSGDVPDALIRQFAVFEAGSVKPEVPNRQATRKFSEVHPVEFTRVVNEIWALTGLGKLAKKKPVNSGKQEK